jgi:hypothetical protein
LFLGLGWWNEWRHEQRFRDHVEELHEELNAAVYGLTDEVDRFDQDDWRDVVPDVRSAVDTVVAKNDALRRALRGIEASERQSPKRATVGAAPAVLDRPRVPLEASADENTPVVMSRDRVFARYPWLANESNPLRRELDAYVEAALRDESRRNLFSRDDWPERIVLEWGVSQGYLRPDGSVITR